MTSFTSSALALIARRWLRSGLKPATGTRIDRHILQSGHVGLNSEKPNRRQPAFKRSWYSAALSRPTTS
jgi:hypothetical protein